MSKIRKKLLDLIESKNWDGLEVFILSTDEQDLLNLLKKTIFTKEGSHVLNCILKSLRKKDVESTNLKMEIYESVLQQMKRYEDTDERQNGNLVTVLMMYADSFPSSGLIRLIDFYLNHLESESTFYGRWTELLSKLMLTSASRTDLVVEGTTMSGEDFQYQVVKKLCDIKWDSQITTTILSILKEVNLPEEIIRDVIKKLRKVLRKIEYQSVPPIVYHMILLCQNTVPSLVLEEITRFFNEQEERLTKQQEKNDSEAISEFDAMETIEKHTMSDLIEAQGTVIHHITDMAKYESRLVRDFLKAIKRSWLTKAIFTPFNLALALSLVHFERYKSQVITALKSAILKHFKIEEKRQRSLWMSEAFKEPINLLKVLKSTLENCKGGWDQVSEGMVLLCFSLLESSASFVGETYPCKQGASLATSILPLLLKREPRLASDILKTISCFILSVSLPYVYIELLSRLIKTNTLVLIDHINAIRELLEQVIYLPFQVGSLLLNALLPLIKLNITLKDALVLVLRKMLFSRELDNRKVAVKGFINILRQFRVMGALPSSQASMSFSSTLSQVTADIHSAIDSNTNEALCLELLGVLRRCFTQQHEVRSTLYEGLFDVTKSNSKLAPNIMELLQQHLSSYIDLNEDILNPILLPKTVSQQGETAILVEPLGELLSCISQCKVWYDNYRSNQSMDDDDDDFVSVLNDICSTFDVLTEKLAFCDLEDINLSNVSFATGTLKGKINLLYAEVMIGVCDALIHYNFSNDALQSEDKMKTVLSLFKTQRKILDALKEKPKPGKKGEGSKSTDKSSKQKQTYSFQSVLSLDVAVKVLQVSINGDEKLNQRCVDLIKDNYEFNMYIISIIDHHVSTLKTLLPGTLDKILPTLKSAGHLLLKESLSSVGESEEDDEDERERARIRQCLVTLHSLMIGYTKYFKDKLPLIFKELSGKSPSKDYDSLLYYTAKACCKALLRVVRKENQSSYAKEASLLIQLIGLVTQQMELNSKGLTDIQDLVNRICKDHSLDSGPASENLVSLLLSTTDGIKVNSNLLRTIAREIHFRLGDVEQDIVVEECDKYKVVTETSSQSLLISLCNNINEIFGFLNLTLFKLRQCLTAREEYNEEEMDTMISLKFAVIVHSLHEIFQSAIPHGTSQDLVLKTATQFYTCICTFVKYYIDIFRIKKNSEMSEKFEKLIHLCANLLKENAYKMINYVHSTQQVEGKVKKITLARRAIKESQLIPRLVFAIEDYEKFLVTLAKKSGVNLLAGTKITTSRDFRIVPNALAEAMKRNEDENDSDKEEEEEMEEDEEQEVAAAEVPEEDSDENRESSPLPKKRENRESSPPPKKRENRESSPPPKKRENRESSPPPKKRENRESSPPPKKKRKSR